MLHMKKIAALGMTVIMVASILPATTLAATHKDEWVKKDGKWYYYDYEGRKVKYDQAYDRSDYKYYLLGSTGARITGKKGLYTQNYKISYYGDKVKFKTSYYFNSDGSLMTHEWKKISGKWYFFGYDGMVKAGTAGKYDEKSGEYKYYLLGNDGAQITKKGWHQVKRKEFNSFNGTVSTVKYWYYVNSDGSCATGWKKISGKKYGFANNAYNLNNGALVCNGIVKTSSGKAYLTNKDGVRVKKTGWVSATIKSSYTGSDFKSSYTNKVWYYLNKDNTVVLGWKKLSGKWYYFEEYNGQMFSSGTSSIWNEEAQKYVTYIFNSKGVCINH